MYPEARLAFLGGSWSKPIIRDLPIVVSFYYVDHWLLNRSNKSFFGKVLKYFVMRSAAIRALKKEAFEVAIDLYPFFPPAHPLFSLADIPLRVGFASAGFGPLLTNAVPFEDADRPIGDYSRDLINEVGVQKLGVSDLNYQYRPAVIDTSIVHFSAYVLIHPGAGAGYKR